MKEKDISGNSRDDPFMTDERDQPQHTRKDFSEHDEDTLSIKDEDDFEEEDDDEYEDEYDEEIEEGEEEEYEEEEDYEEEVKVKKPVPRIPLVRKQRITKIEEEGPLAGIDLKKEVERAERRIRKYIRFTPAEYSPFFSQQGDCKVNLKLENTQLTGSFKLRGTMNKLLSLTKKERKKILVTASSGNHAAAFAYGLKKLGLKGIIYLPGYTSKAKLEALKFYDVVLKLYGTDCVKTEIHAREEADKNDLEYIPPYNDLKIIGGQGTIGIELKDQLDQIDAVLVPVGGGGLISGIASYLKSFDPSPEIIGCQPENSPVMAESIKAGEILEMESKPTLSDGSAGGIEKGSITFDICKKYVDDFILVSEEEIREAIKLLLERHFMLAEGAGVLALASYMKEKERFKGKKVVLIISGSKISLDKLQEVIA